MKYYVYEWYIVKTGEVIYVGKGSRNRYKTKDHNQVFKDIISKYECANRIIKVFENEEEAFKFEHDHINKLWEKGQCKCNLKHGGYGGSTEWWTPEVRQKYSIGNVMKSEAQRERMSKYNPMKDPHVAELVGKKIKRPVIIGITEYDSVKAVCEAYKVSISTVQGWCRNGVTPDGMICHYKDENVIPYFPIKNGQKKSITYLSKHYDSVSELANVLKKSTSTVSRWCRTGYDTEGNVCKYDCDPRENLPEPKHSHIPIIVNGVRYDCKNSACKALNISQYELNTYLNGKKHSDSFICKYDNQQPS